MSRWRSGPETPPATGLTAHDRYENEQWMRYDNNQFADLGTLLSSSFSAAARSRDTRYKPYFFGQEVDDEPMTSGLGTDKPDFVPGELGRKALAMPAEEILRNLPVDRYIGSEQDS